MCIRDRLVGDALRRYEREDVVAALANALESACGSVRAWSMEMALQYPDDRLVSGALAQLTSEDRDARYFAASYLVDLGSTDATVTEALRGAARREDDLEIREVLLEASRPPTLD